MLFLLVLSFYSEFEWVQLEGTNARGISEEIMESSMAKGYGERNLEKRFIYLASGIFSGGCKVLFSKGTAIEGLPRGLKLMKRAIKMKKFDRYSALYKKGELKQEWKKLERESAEKLRISSLSLEELRKILPEENYKEETGEMGTESMYAKMAGIKYPAKTYYSFIEIKENRTVKIIPVVIKLCPLAEKIEEYMNGLVPKGD